MRNLRILVVALGAGALLEMSLPRLPALSCGANLNNLSTYLVCWACDHHQRYPQELGTVLVFCQQLPRCPSTGRFSYTYRRLRGGYDFCLQCQCGNAYDGRRGLVVTR